MLLYALAFIAGGILLPLFAIAVAILAFYRYPKRTTDEAQNLRSLETLSHSVDISQHDRLVVGAQSPELEPGYFTVLHGYDPDSIKETTSQVLIANSGLAEKKPTTSSFAHARDNLSSQLPGREKRSVQRKQGLYYVVLRLKHLVLYEDEEQIEPTHILAIDSYHVDIFGSDATVPEGELFVKRNSIRLRSKLVISETNHHIKELHFLTDNCTYKEDFYLALIKQQQALSNRPTIIRPLTFDAEHMGRLIQLLHGSQTTIQTRWINVLIGRMFLSLYRTEEAEQVIRRKVTKKLKRVRTPSFLSGITIGRVSLGDSAPILTNPKLRELTLEGDMTIEMDIAYVGNFEIEVATTARFDFGRRLGQRETSLMLAVVCKSLKGHLLLRIKPPPSNRVWISFELEPHIELSIEPVVSTRLITFGPLVRAIEGRIRDVVRETLVFPNWDDIPFLDTSEKGTRGGLWKDEAAQRSSSMDSPVPMHPGAMDNANTIILPQSALTTALPLSLDDDALSGADDPPVKLSEEVITPVIHAKTMPTNVIAGSHMSHLSAKLTPLLHTTLRKRQLATTEATPSLPPRGSRSALSEASTSQSSLPLLSEEQ